MADARTPTRRDRSAPALERDVLAMLTDARRRRAAARARQPPDAPGAAAVRARDDHAAQPRGGRRVDARRPAGVRGASLHRAAARRAARGDQRVSAPGRHAARAAHDVSVRAARPRPADGRGDDGAGRRAVHLARAADAARGHPPRRDRAQGAHRRAVVLRRVPRAPGHRRPRHAAPRAAAAGDAVGRRRDDAPRAQDAAGRRADPRSRVDDQRAAQLAHALGAAAQPPSECTARRGMPQVRIALPSQMPRRCSIPELFKAFEAVRWSLDSDVPWDEFDARAAVRRAGAHDQDERDHRVGGAAGHRDVPARQPPRQRLLARSCRSGSTRSRSTRWR